MSAAGRTGVLVAFDRECRYRPVRSRRRSWGGAGPAASVLGPTIGAQVRPSRPGQPCATAPGRGQMGSSEDPVLGTDGTPPTDSGAPGTSAVPDARTRTDYDDDDEGTDDGADRPARVVSRSVVVASLALLLTLVAGGLVTVVSQHGGTRTDGAARQPISSPSAPGSASGPTPVPGPASPAPTAAAPTATEPDLAVPEETTGMAGPVAPPGAVQPIAAAAGSGATHGAPAPTTVRTPAAAASSPPSAGQAAGTAPTNHPTRSGARCGPVAAFVFLFWTVLGLGPC